MILNIYNIFVTAIPLVLLVNILFTTAEQENEGFQPEVGDNNGGGGGDAPTSPPPPSGVGVHYAFSPIHLTYLAKGEKRIYEMMSLYEDALMQRLDTVRRFRTDYENSVFPAVSMTDGGGGEDDWITATYLSSHPILVYKMMHRYSVILRQFCDDITQNLELEVLQTLEGLRGRYFWPGQGDLEDVATGLFRLSEVYDIDPVEFSVGQLSGIQTNIGLTAKHGYDLAEIALSFGDSLTAAEWLKAARAMIIHHGDDSIHLDDIIQPWEKAVRLHDKTWNIDDLYHNIPDIFAESKRQLDLEYEETKWNLSYVNRAYNFKALCRGDIPPIPKRRNSNSAAKCFLLRNDPYFAINPQHVEIHSVDPSILEIHEFFGNLLIQDVSDIVFDPLMGASEHGTWKETTFPHDKGAAALWVEGTVPPRLRKAFNKLEKVMGYGVTTGSEEDEGLPFLYVQSFSVGNYFEPCLQCEDELPQVAEKVGNRVATAEFILDDTEAGGDTVFPQIGLGIRPRKGSLLLFHDEGIHSQDFRRLRASCPVLLGQKWVANKFIYERDQCFPRNTKNTNFIFPLLAENYHYH